MLSYGARTPAEVARARVEREALAARLDAVSPPDARAKADGDLADVVWPRLARRALARAGARAAQEDGGAAWSRVLAAAAGPEDDPSAALFHGTALLLAERSPAARDAFRRWSEGAGRALLRLLGSSDGLAEDASRPLPERVEATALALLGLELVFRTY
jgi:hypothetical protein